MKNPRAILVAEDFAKTDDFSKKRASLIQRLGNDLSVLLSCPVDLAYIHGIAIPVAKKLSTDERQNILTALQQKYASLMHAFKRPGKMIVKLGWPIEELIKLMNKEAHYEALVLGTRGLQGLERFFLGSVAEEVARGVKRPLFILGPEAQKNEFQMSDIKAMKFLVVTDLTKHCRAAETYAISLAKRTGAKVQLYYSLSETIHNAQQYAYASGEALPVFDTIFEDIRKEAAASMKKKIDRLQALGVDCEGHIETEATDLVEGVLKFASKPDHLLFMGHQSHGAIASTILGSNLRRMIARAKVPVVVVRS